MRYARWDLGEAEVLCPDTLKPLVTIYPLNKLANSLGNRDTDPTKFARLTPESDSESEDILSLSTDTLPPLLARLLQQHAQENRLGGYIPLANKETNQ